MSTHEEVVDLMNDNERLRSELAAKDARIAELEIERDTALTDRYDTIQDLRAENEALRKRVGELEIRLASTQTVRKMNAAVADLALANTDSWKARAEQAEAQLAESEASCDRLRSAYDDVRALNAQLAVNHADIVTPLRVELAEAKSALSAMEAKVTRTEGQWAADIRMWQQAVGRLEQAYFRITSLEKSVTVLRAENVELREIAGGLSYYADGHGLQEKWAAELRSLNQRLGALAQATDR